MGENKTKLSLTTVILLIIIVLLAVGIVFMYVQNQQTKMEANEKVSKLNADINSVETEKNNLNKQIDVLQEKIDKINNTLNGEKEDTLTPEPSVKPDTNNEESKINSEDNTVSEDEIDKIEEFLQKRDNMAFLYIEFDNPEDCISGETSHDTVKGTTYTEKNTVVLRYSINSCEYREDLRGTKLEDSMLDGFSISISNLQKYLKEKLNYNFTEAEIKECFSYDEKSGKIAYIVSDALFESTPKVTDIEKKDGKYIVSVSKKDSNLKVTLGKENGRYYFCACEEV